MNSKDAAAAQAMLGLTNAAAMMAGAAATSSNKRAPRGASNNNKTNKKKKSSSNNNKKRGRPQFKFPVEPTVIQVVDKPREYMNHSYRDFSQVPPEMNDVLPTKISEMSFAEKVHDILAQPAYKKFASWHPHGRSFKVFVPVYFERNVCEKYFGHKRYSSFLRQLNNYGFKHISKGPDRNSYYHEFMLQGLPHLAQYMPKCKDARRLVPDPENEPDFYKISQLYPLKAAASGGVENKKSVVVEEDKKPAAAVVPHGETHTPSSIINKRSPMPVVATTAVVAPPKPAPLAALQASIETVAPRVVAPVAPAATLPSSVDMSAAAKLALAAAAASPNDPSLLRSRLASEVNWLSQPPSKIHRPAVYTIQETAPQPTFSSATTDSTSAALLHALDVAQARQQQRQQAAKEAALLAAVQKRKQEVVSRILAGASASTVGTSNNNLPAAAAAAPDTTSAALLDYLQRMQK